MKATNTDPAAELKDNQQGDRPYCAGERCAKCPRAETCRTYWGGNFCAARQAAQWDTFTDAELARAVELMIAPDDLTIRGAALALFAVFSYTPEDVREVLDSGDYLNAGAVFDGLASDTPRILYPDEA